MKTIKIYTDGSCYYKTKQGGIGVYIVNTNTAIRKGFKNTTNSRMEIIAVLYAIKHIKNISCRVIIKLDNQYVVKSLREGWVYRWEHEGLENRKNGDLWEKVLKEIRLRDKVKFRFEWVRGHQKDIENEDAFYNNLVDSLSDYKNFKEEEREIDLN